MGIYILMFGWALTNVQSIDILPYIWWYTQALLI
jgi:hypothetical protein